MDTGTLLSPAFEVEFNPVKSRAVSGRAWLCSASLGTAAPLLSHTVTLGVSTPGPGCGCPCPFRCPLPAVEMAPAHGGSAVHPARGCGAAGASPLVQLVSLLGRGSCVAPAVGTLAVLVLAACLLPRGSARPAGSGTEAAVATAAHAASNVCRVKSIRLRFETARAVGPQTAHICLCWDMSPLGGGRWVRCWAGHTAASQGAHLTPALSWRREDVCSQPGETNRFSGGHAGQARDSSRPPAAGW